MACTPVGSSLPGISQARIGVCVAVSSSRGIFLTQGSNPRLLYLLHWQVDPLATEPFKESGLCLFRSSRLPFVSL